MPPPSSEDVAKGKSKLRSKRGIARGQSIDMPPGEDLIILIYGSTPFITRWGFSNEK